MEPERHIEKALRNLAKQRRDEAGEPPELHPATRRLFQAEIARQYAKRQRASDRSFFARFGRVFAYAACFLALIVSGILFMPSLRSSRSKEVASNRLPSADALSLEKASAPQTSEARRDEPKKPFANEEASSRLAAAESLNQQPTIITNGVQPAPTLEPAAAPPVADTQIALANKPAAPPIAPPAEVAGAAPQQLFFQRAKVGRDSGVKARETNGTSEQTPVLLSFKVLQQDSKLTLVDCDGSVYEGRVLTALNAADSFNLAASDKPTSKGLLEGNAASNGRLTLPFTVTGTNLTLQEQVVFIGSFSNTQSVVSSTAEARSETGADSLGVPSLSSSNWTVIGTAIVGATNQLKVEAAPSSPTAFLEANFALFSRYGSNHPMLSFDGFVSTNAPSKSETNSPGVQKPKIP